MIEAAESDQNNFIDIFCLCQ